MKLRPIEWLVFACAATAFTLALANLGREAAVFMVARRGPYDLETREAGVKVLDLFCGAGGAAMGLHRAWPEAEIVGVDIAPQKHYPFEFRLADATSYPLEGFQFIWASPPCQDHMQTPHRKHGTGWMLPKTRERLVGADCHWAIENVEGAPLRPDYILCGCQFGLPNLRRVRWFETSWNGFSLLHTHNHEAQCISVVGRGTPSWVRKKLGRRCPSIHEYRAAMGIDWMNRYELSQAIPPAYSEFIGRAALKVMAPMA